MVPFPPEKTKLPKMPGDISALFAKSGTQTHHRELDLNNAHTVAGANGTIREQIAEDHLDKRSYADDDLEKGKIRFPPNRLYGRDKELRLLQQDVYGDVAIRGGGYDFREEAAPSSSSALPKSRSTSRAVFLGGLPGTGKSALIAELISKINGAEKDNPSRRPLFGSGKFEQFHHAAPFSALADAVAMWTTELLERRDDEEELRLVRKAIKKAGLCVSEDDGQILVGMFPALEPLLGTRSANGSTKGNDMKRQLTREESMRRMRQLILDITRLKIVFINFVVALGRKQERPLVLFVDDLQWADEASLEIITALLLDKTVQHLLFIGSYRSNEVNGDDDHPWAKRMKVIEAGIPPGAATHMEISGLLPKDIAQFVADTTDREVKDVGPLVDLVYKKTLGNIFFVRQALEELVRLNILYYDMICYEWQWNLDAEAEIDDFVSGDNLEMIIGKVGELSDDCQRSLALMAYAQKIIKAPILLALMEADGRRLDLQHMVNVLEEAATEGLLLPTENNQEYAFAHDLIGQAARSLVPEGAERDALLVQIAKVLVDRERTDGENWMLFVAARHFNSVPREYIESLEELASLNVRTAKIAASKASLDQAVFFLRSAVSCLDKDTCWHSVYDFALDTHNRLIHIEYAFGNYEHAKATIDVVLQHATSLRDKSIAHVTLIKLASEASDNGYAVAAAIGLDILKEYGQNIPLKPSKMDVAKEWTRLRIMQKNHPLVSLADLSVMKDDSVMKIIEEIQRNLLLFGGGAFLDLSQMLILRCLRICFAKGICYDTANICLTYALSLQREEKFRSAYKYTNLATLIKGRFSEVDNGGEATKFQFRVASMSNNHLPFSDGIGQFHELYRRALSHGMTGVAFAAAMTESFCHFGAGLLLNSFFGSKLMLYERTAAQTNQKGFGIIFKASRQFLLNLSGKSEGKPTIFKGVALDEEEVLSKMDGNAHSMALRDISTFRLQLSYIFNDDEVMAEMVERLKTYPMTDWSFVRSVVQLNFLCLACLTLGIKMKNIEYLRLAKKIMQRYKKLNKGGSVNTIPLSMCFDAIKSQKQALYDEAIEACNNAGMKHIEAIMCERCGMLLMEQRKERMAEQYIIRAYFVYNDWGAGRKLKQLAETYNFLEKRKLIFKSLLGCQGTVSSSYG